MKTVLAVFLSVLPSMVSAQTINAWTNATSSYWEFQTNWSLGTLPNQTQSVYITNSGYKAVAIGGNTAQHFTNSMSIQSLQLAAPSNSLNVLLMNFSGFQVPLRTTGVSIGANCSIIVQSSWFADSGGMFVWGSFKQGDFARVDLHDNVQIFTLGTDAGPAATYFLTNGTLSADSGLYVGGGLGRSGNFYQYGGSNNVNNLSIVSEGELDIYGGELTATNGIQVGGGDFARSSSLHQYGGTVSGDTIVNGIYVLEAGVRTGALTAAVSGQRADASIIQNGGTNTAPSMDLGHPNRFGGGCIYTLSNGVVRVDNSTTFGGGWFYQSNGVHTVGSNFIMQGRDVGVGNAYAEYFLSGGIFSVGNLTAQLSHFFQDGGTNRITNSLVLALTLPSASTYYSMSGGTLIVKDIEIDANAFFQHTGGNITQSGTLLLNQGEWRAANGDYSLGSLTLGTPTNITGFHTNSAILFPDGSSTLRLANSSAQPWFGGTFLYVTNWHGSFGGGGATRLYFGSNSGGLTQQQLSQVRFALPGGLAAATILSTGEVVPVSPATLQASASGNALTLTWPSGWMLQSATNVAGPYQDVSGASSPYHVSMTAPREFFRLRQ